jgi:hypothetical protein
MDDEEEEEAPAGALDAGRGFRELAAAEGASEDFLSCLYLQSDRVHPLASAHLKQGRAFDDCSKLSACRKWHEPPRLHPPADA